MRVISPSVTCAHTTLLGSSLTFGSLPVSYFQQLQASLFLSLSLVFCQNQCSLWHFRATTTGCHWFKLLTTRLESSLKGHPTPLVSSSLKLAHIQTHMISSAWFCMQCQYLPHVNMSQHLSGQCAQCYPPCTQSTPPFNSIRYQASLFYIFQSSLVSFYLLLTHGLQCLKQPILSGFRLEQPYLAANFWFRPRALPIADLVSHSKHNLGLPIFCPKCYLDPTFWSQMLSSFDLSPRSGLASSCFCDLAPIFCPRYGITPITVIDMASPVGVYPICCNNFSFTRLWIENSCMNFVF